MSNNTTATTSYTKAQIKTLSHNAYEAIKTYEEQVSARKKPSLDDLIKATAPCLRAYGVPADTDTMQMVLQRLVSFGKKDGNTGWKILGVTTFRKLMTTWDEVIEGKGVIYAKNDKPAATKEKKPNKSELEKQLAEQAKELEELRALLDAATK